MLFLGIFLACNLLHYHRLAAQPLTVEKQLLKRGILEHVTNAQQHRLIARSIPPEDKAEEILDITKAEASGGQEPVRVGKADIKASDIEPSEGLADINSDLLKAEDSKKFETLRVEEVPASNKGSESSEAERASLFRKPEAAKGPHQAVQTPEAKTAESPAGAEHDLQTQGSSAAPKVSAQSTLASDEKSPSEVKGKKYKKKSGAEPASEGDKINPKKGIREGIETLARKWGFQKNTKNAPEEKSSPLDSEKATSTIHEVESEKTEASVPVNNGKPELQSAKEKADGAARGHSNDSPETSSKGSFPKKVKSWWSSAIQKFRKHWNNLVKKITREDSWWRKALHLKDPVDQGQGSSQAAKATETATSDKKIWPDSAPINGKQSQKDVAGTEAAASKDSKDKSAAEPQLPVAKASEQAAPESSSGEKPATAEPSRASTEEKQEEAISPNTKPGSSN